MKAIVCTKYGGPELLKLTHLDKPSPKDNEVLIKINATSVTSGDARLRRADPAVIRLIFGFKKPRKSILGIIVSGEIEAVGKEVTRFKKGDHIFGSTGMKFGAHAEYVTVKESGTLALKPENISHEEAAAIPFGATAALHFIRKAKVGKGQKILIYGASGAIGTAAIQLCKYFGAEVTAVCGPTNQEMVKNLGADKAIDYTKEDFSKSGEKYDFIFETVGKSSFSGSIKALKESGVLMLASGGFKDMINGMFTSLFSKKKVLSGVIKETAEDMTFLKELIETGNMKAVIDKTYPFEEFQQAHAHVDKGHKKGNVIIKVV